MVLSLFEKRFDSSKKRVNVVMTDLDEVYIKESLWNFDCFVKRSRSFAMLFIIWDHLSLH